MQRTKIMHRKLPSYTKGEETLNMITHIVGGGMGIIILLLCIFKSLHSPGKMVGSLIYAISMILVYSISSIYHGLLPGTGKKVLQVIDHCAIYLLIAGTYTPILLCSLIPAYPIIGWGLLSVQWTLAALAVTLTAIDLKKYAIFSMICYIFMGWSIVLFSTQALQTLTTHGFLWLFAGGITYTTGAVLYGIGAKKPWFHGIFHIFVVAGSLLQFIAIYQYVL